MSNFPFLLQDAVSYMSVSYWRGLAVFLECHYALRFLGEFSGGSRENARHFPHRSSSVKLRVSVSKYVSSRFLNDTF